MSPSAAANAQELNRAEPQPDMPKSNLAPVATNPLDTKRLDPENTLPVTEDQSTTALRARTAPNRPQDGLFVPMTPVNDLRAVVDRRPFRPKESPEMSLFVPNCVTMMKIIYTMNDQIITVRDFGERGTINDWIPQVTILYYSVLFYIQVLRSQQLGSCLSPQEASFLDAFIQKYPLEQIMIAGPLVPFFRSLSLCSTGLESFGDVCPSLVSFKLEEEHLFDMVSVKSDNTVTYSLSRMIPHIALLLDQFYAVITHVNSGGANTYTSWNHANIIFGVPNANNRPVPIQNAKSRLQSSISLSGKPFAPDELVKRFGRYVLSHSEKFPSPLVYDENHEPQPIPAPPIPAAAPAAPGVAGPAQAPAAPAVPQFTPDQYTTASDFRTIMQMDVTMEWFSVLAKGMEKFHRHWLMNKRMIDIHPSLSAAPLVLFKSIVPTPKTTRTPFGINNNNNDQSTHIYATLAVGLHATPYISAYDLSDANVAMVNAVFADLQDTNGTPGEIGVTRSGPYWSASPVEGHTSALDIQSSIDAIVLTSYFVEKRA